jgi:hypothetical protein
MKSSWMQEVAMRRMTLVAIITVLIAASIGIWNTRANVAPQPGTGAPAIAAMSPLELMKERGKNLPAGINADPF